MVTRDDLNRVRTNQSQLSGSSLRKCPECRGSNADTEHYPGLSTVWNPTTKTYDLCERCEGSGRVPR